MSPLDSIDISGLKDGLGNLREIRSAIDSVRRQSERTNSKVNDLDSKLFGFSKELTAITNNTKLLYRNSEHLNEDGLPDFMHPKVDKIEYCVKRLVIDVAKCSARVSSLQGCWQDYENSWKNDIKSLMDGIFPRRLESCSPLPERETANSTALGSPPGNGPGLPQSYLYPWIPGNDLSRFDNQIQPLPKAYYPANWEGTQGNRLYSMGSGQNTTVT